jgi:CHASE1-domain containing sensor protein
MLQKILAIFILVIVLSSLVLSAFVVHQEKKERRELLEHHFRELDTRLERLRRVIEEKGTTNNSYPTDVSSHENGELECQTDLNNL